MIDHGAKVNCDVYCCTNISEDSVKWLLNHSVNINGNIQYKKHTPLFNCCLGKYYDDMELLMNYGADIHQVCTYNDKTLSCLDICKETFPAKYYDHFKNYKQKKKNKYKSTYAKIKEPKYTDIKKQ
eukprot:170617_1